uniref:Viral A-type inclusion protein n=1 Tax=Strongyloides stercoralis TaxID=6248 RepID=A0A0K0E4J7_STRER
MASKKQKIITQDSAKNIISGIKPTEVYSFKNSNSTIKTKNKDIIKKAEVNNIETISDIKQNNNLIGNKEYDNPGMSIILFDFQRNLSNIETKQTLLQNDISNIKLTLNNHEQEIYSHDTIHRIKQLDTKLKNIQSQVNDVTKNFEKETIEKGKQNAMHVEAYNKLQDYINNQLTLDKNTFNNAFIDIQRENNILKNQITKIEKDLKNDIKKFDKNFKDIENKNNNLSKEFQNTNSKSVDEIKSLKNEVLNTNNALRNNINNQLEKLVIEFNTNDKKSKTYIDEKNQQVNEKIDSNFHSVNDSINEVRNSLNGNVKELMTLYKNTDNKVEEIDKVVKKMEKSNLKAMKESQALSNTTKRHEESIIKKLTFLENQLHEYIDNVNKKMEYLENDVEQKLIRQKSNESLQSTSTNTIKSIVSTNTPEKIKEELLAIINEKEKLSYSGMLAVEGKFLNIQTQLENFKNEYNMKLKKYPNNKTINDMKKQMTTFEGLINQVSDSQKALSKKIEEEIPENINELSLKTNNAIKALDNKYLQEINLLQNNLAEINKSKKATNKEIEENKKQRNRHEQLIMNKLMKLEDDVNSYINLKMNEVEEIEKRSNDKRSVSRLSSKQSRRSDTISEKNIDIEKIRAELHSIVNDKAKLTYQTTLTIEEKVLNLQERLNNFRKELDHKLNEKGLDDPRVIDLQKQMLSVKVMMKDMEKVQNEMKEKLENEVPENMEEMSMKMKSALNLIGKRIAQEEEERYLAIHELQDVCEVLMKNYQSVRGNNENKNSDQDISVKEMKQEIEECKNAVKKLAESLTAFRDSFDNHVNKKK